MYHVIILAFALSMDAFAVSIGLGTKNRNNPKRLALFAALYFGLFQGLMPIIGYLAGKSLLSWVEVSAPWIAFLLLLLVGGKMIYEAFSRKIESIDKDIAHISHRILFILAIATSIDAMAAGFSLNILEVNAIIACAVIGLVTALMSYVGVFVGIRGGEWLESKAEFLGGVIFILIGLKIILVPVV